MEVRCKGCGKITYNGPGFPPDSRLCIDCRIGEMAKESARKSHEKLKEVTDQLETDLASIPFMKNKIEDLEKRLAITDVALCLCIDEYASAMDLRSIDRGEWKKRLIKEAELCWRIAVNNVGVRDEK